MDFNFETLGESKTDDELAISQSLKEFGRILRDIEEERMKIVGLRFHPSSWPVLKTDVHFC